MLRVIGEGAETSAFLALFTMILIIAIGIPAGIVSASFHGTRIDQSLSGLTMLFASIPTFWLGLYLIFTVAVGLDLLPTSGFPSVLESGDLSNLRYLILPAITLSAPNSALVIRLVRAGMLDVMREDYVRTARAKGIAEHAVILRHVFRNALIGVVATLGFTFVGLVSEAVVTETVFALPGHRPAGGAVDPAPRLPGDPGHHPRDHPVLHRGQSGGRHRHHLPRSAGQAAVSAVLEFLTPFGQRKVAGVRARLPGGGAGRGPAGALDRALRPAADRRDRAPLAAQCGALVRHRPCRPRSALAGHLRRPHGAPDRHRRRGHRARVRRAARHAVRLFPDGSAWC